ncbi:unnamed protein product [Merluccius merluccius]
MLLFGQRVLWDKMTAGDEERRAKDRDFDATFKETQFARITLQNQLDQQRQTVKKMEGEWEKATGDEKEKAAILDICTAAREVAGAHPPEAAVVLVPGTTGPPGQQEARTAGLGDSGRRLGLREMGRLDLGTRGCGEASWASVEVLASVDSGVLGSGERLEWRAGERLEWRAGERLECWAED